jgi:AGZA family xanthine/uracil permease-like MFS transporter
VALGFISLGFVFRAFERPIIGLVTLAVILLTYFGKVHFKGGLPGGLVAVGVGSILAWALGIAPVGEMPTGAGFHLPVPVLGDLVEAFRGGFFATYFSIILPMGIFNLIGSLQNIESAEAAGDSYSTRSSLAVNGMGTFFAALFGSCFPTTLYIGHPGWKALGARAGYSILNGAVVTVVCLTGTLAFITWAVPIDAGLAIVIWIAVVITSQAFEAVPRSHIPAAVIGLLPSLAAWGALLAKTGLRAAGVGSPSGPPFSKDLLAAFRAQDVWIHGAFALERGFIFSAMILSAASVFVIERRFTSAGVWCLIGAALCACGLMHSYAFTPTDTVVHLAPAWPWAIGYAGMGVVFLLAPVLTREREEE